MKALLASVGLIGLAMYLVESTVLEALAVAVSAHVFLVFVAKIGKTIALLPCISFIASLEILLVPALTYWVFPSSMPIDSTVYFSYALPAFLAFYAGLNRFSSRDLGRTHVVYMQAGTAYLQTKPATCIVLLAIGLLGFIIKMIVPTAPAMVGTIPSYCLCISAFYAYYSRSPYRFVVIGLAAMVLLVNTVWTGMFGDLFFWLLLAVLFLAAGMPDRITTSLKTTVILSAFAFLLLIQSIKGEYRYNTWGYSRAERTANTTLMAELLADRLTHPEKLLNADHAFLSFVRFNQGIMIGSAMAKVPLHEDYARGAVLLSLIYPFIPRLFWANKPQTGGYENIRRFTSLRQTENTSINLSPLGEGYVNFGYGGVLFALFYGLLLGGAFHYVLRLAERMPSLIFWLPMLYIGCLTMETDLLSTWGSLLNNALFIALLFWVSKRVGIHL
ncbi:hypothetical protein [Spirosoma radiotolerans]|uniref:Oligosaccharide repeat unit polymerase n=1 Tax=Spirosoma radiotolerans TaxID=1379870 RepID=A0A0E3ZXI2_9BACT|nr:hypothetical protein [Spirosoma radiotolerans]AKD56944.1 hypothetical protein SD10_20580 [Spirosoma radiotolerans]